MSGLLEVQNLNRSFGTGSQALLAVNNVSFALNPGEIISVVGESGSGKSTLARLMLRLLPPTGGNLKLYGADVASIAHRAYWREVQAVFQDPYAAFNQFYSVGRILAKSLALLNTPLSAEDKRSRMETALEGVGLKPSETLHKFTHQLSGGQRQRVMMARALMLKPKLLIADEPTSALDASLRVNILNLLQDLRRSHGMSIVFITHDIGQAYYMSDRILVMYRGELVEQGPVEEVVANSKHPYTQRLLADVPRFHQ